MSSVMGAWSDMTMFWYAQEWTCGVSLLSTKSHRYLKSEVSQLSYFICWQVKTSNILIQKFGSKSPWMKSFPVCKSLAFRPTTTYSKLSYFGQCTQSQYCIKQKSETVHVYLVRLLAFYKIHRASTNLPPSELQSNVPPAMIFQAMSTWA